MRRVFLHGSPRASAALALALTLTLAGCVPDFDVDESLVDARRVLAIRAEPAEARPGDVVTYEALVGEPDGTVTTLPIEWAYCVESAALAELGPVSAGCVAGEPDAIAAFGSGPTASGAVPADACRFFGPDPALGPDGEAGRPTDPDATGGYRQPVRASFPTDAGADVAFFEERILCGLPGVGSSDSFEWNQRYRPNANPALEAVEVVRAGGAVEPWTDGDLIALAPGERVEVVVRWPACPLEASCGDGVCVPDETDADCAADCAPAPRSCAGAEAYLYFDRSSRTFAVGREAMRVAWTATAAGFAEARTGASAESHEHESRNVFVAPEAPGPVHAWIVLRDERGGVDFRAVALEVVAP